MTTCEKCGANIMDTTDDNYNSDGSMIKCEECGHWQWMEDEDE